MPIAILIFLKCFCIFNPYRVEVYGRRLQKVLRDEVAPFSSNAAPSRRTISLASDLGAQIELLVGNSLVNFAVTKYAVGSLNDLLEKVKIPDLPLDLPLAGEGALVLRGLDIEGLHFSDVHVIDSPPKAANEVGSVRLQAKAAITVRTALGGRGGSKITLGIENTLVHIGLSLGRRTNHSAGDALWLTVKTLRFQGFFDGPTIRKSLELKGAEWRDSFRNIALRVGTEAIYLAVYHGVNGWGSGTVANHLSFPLAALGQIALGPGGQRYGFSYTYDWCRATAKVDLSDFSVIAPRMGGQALHILASFEPHVRNYMFPVTGSNNPFGTVYEGMPMPLTSDDVGNVPYDTFNAALDACLSYLEDECNSIYTKRFKGALKYFLGRTVYPMQDAEELWQPCAAEGHMCRWSDDAPIGNPKTGENMWIPGEHGGRTLAERFVRIRFGVPGDWIERTYFDTGAGIPCQWYYFNDMRATGPSHKSGDGQNRICERLTVRDKWGSRNATVATPNSPCDASFNCPLSRPCAIDAGGAKMCLDRKDGACPRPSTDCWKDKNAVTQPVPEHDREVRRCSGPNQLCCSDGHWDRRPPAETRLGTSATTSPTGMTLHLSPDVINAALATYYSAGTWNRKPFSIESIDNIGKLCAQLQGFLCISGKGLTDATPITLGIVQEQPARLTSIGGELHLNAAMLVSVYTMTGGTELIPPEELWAPAKQCLRKDGLLDVSVWNPVGGYTEWKRRWVEIEFAELKLYKMPWRKKKGKFSLSGSMAYNVREAPNDLRCFEMYQTVSRTYRLCADRPEARDEWLRALAASKSRCATRPFRAAAWFRFSVDLRASLEVQTKYLCLRPGTSSSKPFKVMYTGKLHMAKSASGGCLGSAGLVVGKAVPNTFITALLKYQGVLKPYEVWNMDSLKIGLGLRNPEVTINDGYIGLNGEAFPVPDEAKASEDGNHCLG